MKDYRRINIPEKERPLRADVNLLGTLLGDLLAEQHGPDVLERVETIRRAAIRERDEGGPGDLEALLADLDNDQAQHVIQAFAAYLRLVNLAEKVHRLRRRRVYLRAQIGAQPGSLEHALGLMKQEAVAAERHEFIRA